MTTVNPSRDITPQSASKPAAPPAPQAAGKAPVWDYAPAPESTKIEIAGRYGLFIDGSFVEPSSGAYRPTHNPATELQLSETAEAGDADVDRAVAAARAALGPWSSLPALERGKMIYRIARRMQERARELAILETMDNGKPIRESRDVDVPLAAAHFFYHAGWADKLQHAFAGATPRPVGVCGQIIPWNFPLLMLAWKIAPALACGNTVVLKPAETTPLTALRMAEIFAEVGLPRGVVNIVTGGPDTGRAITAHPGIDKIAFTGSTEVGKAIAKAVAGRDIKLTLELGGKAANIVFDDASLDQAVEGIVAGIYFNQGQVCCAGSRLLVQEGVLEQVIHKLRDRMAQLRVGDPLDKNTDVGAINSREQLDRISRLTALAQREGGTLHEVEARPLPERGYWCRPSFVTDVLPGHTIAREEVFGPVLAVMSFRTPDEAVARANNTPYGLSAGVWTDKGSKVFDMARKLRAGVVWCNTFNRFDPTAAFGGMKESGFGREGGVSGLRAYCRF